VKVREICGNKKRMVNHKRFSNFFPRISQITRMIAYNFSTPNKVQHKHLCKSVRSAGNKKGESQDSPFLYY